VQTSHGDVYNEACKTVLTNIILVPGTFRVCFMGIDLIYGIKHLNAELNPICHLLALDRHIFHVSGLRVKHSLQYSCN